LLLVESIEERTLRPHRVTLRRIAYAHVVQIVKYEVQSFVLVGEVVDLRAHGFGAEFEGFKDGIHTSCLS